MVELIALVELFHEKLHHNRAVEVARLAVVLPPRYGCSMFGLLSVVLTEALSKQDLGLPRVGHETYLNVGDSLEFIAGFAVDFPDEEHVEKSSFCLVSLLRGDDLLQFNSLRLFEPVAEVEVLLASRDGETTRFVLLDDEWVEHGVLASDGEHTEKEKDPHVVDLVELCALGEGRVEEV